tara:strand:- start:1826 stop:2185 length:360 start_codon:yes stop_codon:yes gene_type:complete
MKTPHGQWKTSIDIRNAELTSDWWPFVENINDILERLKELEGDIEIVDNKVSEAVGLGKGLYKLLYKLGLLDKEFKVIWPAAQRLREVLEEPEEEENAERNETGKGNRNGKDGASSGNV